MAKVSIRVSLLPVLLLLVSACSDHDCYRYISDFDDCANPDSEGVWQRIEFYGVDRSSWDYGDGTWGKHLTYFPFVGDDLKNRERNYDLDTDEEGVLIVNRDFDDLVHWDDIWNDVNPQKFDNRTFSMDDYHNRNELGVKTAGGEGWPDIATPPDKNGISRYGESGVFYDPGTYDKRKNKGSSNNTINQLKVRNRNLHSFCLQLVTDNTNHIYDPSAIVGRGDNDLAEAKVPDNYLVFNNVPDVYTFKYTGFEHEDKIKVRLKGRQDLPRGAGLAGLMVSDIRKCCDEEKECTIENECGGENDCGGLCDCENSEQHVEHLTPGESRLSHVTENSQEYYIRGLYTRQVLTIDLQAERLTVEPRRNLKTQRWVFVGECVTDSRCKGYFYNKLANGCLALDDGIVKYVEAHCSEKDAKWTVEERGKDRLVYLGSKDGNGDSERVPFSSATAYSLGIDRGRFHLYLTARSTGIEARSAMKDLALVDSGDAREGGFDINRLERLRDELWVKVARDGNWKAPWEQWIFEHASFSDQPIPD